jgi:hypothetical protein
MDLVTEWSMSDCRVLVVMGTPFAIEECMISETSPSASMLGPPGQSWFGRIEGRSVGGGRLEETVLDETVVAGAAYYKMVQKSDAEDLGSFAETTGNFAVLRARIEAA